MNESSEKSSSITQGIRGHPSDRKKSFRNKGIQVFPKRVSAGFNVNIPTLSDNSQQFPF